MKQLLGSILMLIMLHTMYAQESQVLDKIIAKVGDEYVLHSEIEEQYALWKEKGSVPDDARCTILESTLVTNLLVHRARIDSVEVTKVPDSTFVPPPEIQALIKK